MILWWSHYGGTFEFLPLLRVYKNGYVQRLLGTDPQTGRRQPKTPNNNTTNKLPLLFHVHGGAFCLSTPSTLNCHIYLNTMVSEAQVVAVSVHWSTLSPIPIGQEDSWASLHWVWIFLDLLWHPFSGGFGPIGSESIDPDRKVNPVVDGGASLVGLGCGRMPCLLVWCG
ncbi:unnamed protein product [Coffea canephora]|uniref:Alpha/beta hydrolase fold-3 domain-containing protein n=1 Tax=Coffea canephora TaxID=49390 RepID=A0A068TYH1_COFCA|nr:unnamed protein product [Coffea canephora]